MAREPSSEENLAKGLIEVSRGLPFVGAVFEIINCTMVQIFNVVKEK